MSDKLIEALAWYDDDDIDHRLHPHFATALDAARRWASFPTDEDVDLAMKVMLTFGPIASVSGMRAALEAVKEDR